MIERVAVRAVEMYRRRSFYHDTNAPIGYCYTNSARGLGGPLGRRGLVAAAGGCHQESKKDRQRCDNRAFAGSCHSPRQRMEYHEIETARLFGRLCKIVLPGFKVK